MSEDQRVKRDRHVAMATPEKQPDADIAKLERIYSVLSALIQDLRYNIRGLGDIRFIFHDNGNVSAQLTCKGQATQVFVWQRPRSVEEQADEWREGNDITRELADHLGWTTEQYHAYLETGEAPKKGDSL